VLTEAGDLADRIAGIVQLANGFPERDREEILAAAETQFLATFPESLPQAGVKCRDDAYATRISERLSQAFDSLPGHGVEVCVRELQGAVDTLPGTRQRGFDVLITIRFPDEQGAVFHAVLPDESSIFADPVMLYFLLVLALAMLVAAYLVKRVVAPMERLAGAAETIGLDIDTPPLPIEGPAEVRAAAGALNQMHDRLQRLIHNQRDILAAVSHDLRSSLTRLQLRVDLLKDDSAREGLARVVTDMQGMVEGVLDFVRGVDADETPRRVDVGALLESLCIDLMEEGYPVDWREAPQPALVHGRPTALRRAFQNLILNAIKYGDSARVALKVVAGEVQISIRDRGPGIPSGELGAVMAPFYRLERSRNPDTGGLGLGLAIVQNVVQAHGGSVRLSNHPEGGLLAEVTLPVMESAAATMTTSEHLESPKAGH
jgi:signal transduction histidine kinase